MVSLLSDYLKVARELGEEPDADLLAPIVAKFEEIKEKRPPRPILVTQQERVRMRRATPVAGDTMLHTITCVTQPGNWQVRQRWIFSRVCRSRQYGPLFMR